MADLVVLLLADAVIEELQTLYTNSAILDKPLVFASKTAFGRIDLKKAWKEALKRAGIDRLPCS